MDLRVDFLANFTPPCRQVMALLMSFTQDSLSSRWVAWKKWSWFLAVLSLKTSLKKRAMLCTCFMYGGGGNVFHCTLILYVAKIVRSDQELDCLEHYSNDRHLYLYLVVSVPPSC